MDLHMWNKSHVARQLWLLFSSSGSLWIAWGHIVLLKGKCIWLARKNALSSWNWKKQLCLRDELRQLIKCRFGNGEKFLFWVDNWHPLVPLISYRNHVIFGSGIPLSAKLSSVIRNSLQDLPPARSSMLHIHASLCQILPSTLPYSFVWTSSKCGSFHLGSTWNRSPRPNVTWFSLIQFKDMIPRHSFICWLAVLDRLSTRAILHYFNPEITSACVFYGLDETRYHLFFSCSFSSQVLSSISSITYHTALISWDQLLNWGCLLKGKSLKSKICNLTWQATIHHLQLEWNARIHSQKSRVTDSVSESILLKIRYQLISFSPSAIQQMDPNIAQFLSLNINWP